MIPRKLKTGDEIRVIAPARSIGLIGENLTKIAKEKLEEMGFKVTFGKNVNEKDEFISSSIKSRIQDLHEAFLDKNVKMIMPVIGGYNSNQLLKSIDWSIIKENPKIIGGYSDITALQNALFAKTGLVTYSSPNFSVFGMKKGFEYIKDYFNKCLIEEKEFFINPSEKWSNDAWYLNQEDRLFIKNEGPYVINEGETEGEILGGNLCTFQLLHGTEYIPSLKGSILFLEDDEYTNPMLFDRDLQSLIHQSGFSQIKGIIIGRFEKKSEFTKEILTKVIKTKKELDKIPVIADVDFGHTYPMITFPIGGKARISAFFNKKIKIEILEH